MIYFFSVSPVSNHARFMVEKLFLLEVEEEESLSIAAGALFFMVDSVSFWEAHGADRFFLGALLISAAVLTSPYTHRDMAKESFLQPVLCFRPIFN